MTQAQILQIVSWLGTALGGVFVSKGWLTNDEVTQFVAVLVTVATLSYTIYASLPKQQISTTAALPQVQSVALHDPALAQSIPASNVVPAQPAPSSK